MNRSELASILAQNDPSVYPASQTSETHSAARVRNPPLSPRQMFQSQIRSLAHNRLPKPEISKIHPPKAGGQLQHLSSLRARESRSHSALPRAEPLQTWNYADDEPDFVIEEREAWSRRSPDRETESSIKDFQTAIVLQPPEEGAEPPPQPRKQHGQELPLRPFEHLQTADDLNERPKTRHGPASGMQGQFPIYHEGEDIDSDATSTAGTIEPARRSKFLEGSMNNRSIALASSWQTNNVTSGEEAGLDTDSDATPRPSRESGPSSLFENDDYVPPPTTPSTAKRGFLRFRSNVTSSEDSEKPTESSPKKPRKGLKKSLSTWNFHNLGEKMRFFGGSSTDLTPKPSHNVPDKKNETSSTDDSRNVLNERKRRAELEYAAQFGQKKQKSNFGLPSGSSSHPVIAPASSLRNRRSLSGSNTSAPQAASRRRRASSGPIARPPSSDHLSETDLRKQRSRRDLEKENQQLRELLRESQSQHFTRSVSSHLSQNMAAHDREEPVLISPGMNVPPVPTLKARHHDGQRQVLGNLSNSSPLGQVQAPTSFRARGTGSLKTRPVSMIAEENEEEPSDQPKATEIVGGMGSEGRHPEQWEWPDDVF